MKLFVVLALAAVACAAPLERQLSPDGAAETLEYKSNNIGTPEGYQTLFKTSNGIAQQEEGGIADLGTENEGLEVRGQFSYTGNDGNLYQVTYTAGRNGFQPSGAHLPQA